MRDRCIVSGPSSAVIFVLVYLASARLWTGTSYVTYKASPSIIDRLHFFIPHTSRMRLHSQQIEMLYSTHANCLSAIEALNSQATGIIVPLTNVAVVPTIALFEQTVPQHSFGLDVLSIGS